MPTRVLGVGAAAGSLRLAAADVAAAWNRPPGRGQVAVCAPDEDTLTLAWSAASAALAAAEIDPGHVDGLWWGTTRPPFAEGPSHAVLAAALGLATTSTGLLCAGSPHAGIEALLAASDAIGAGSARVALVVASDALRPAPGGPAEPRTGAGAAAFVLAASGGRAALVARVTRTRPLLDRYRGDGETDTRDLYDARLFRDEIFLPTTTEVATELAVFEPRAWSLPDPDGRLGNAVARAVGAAPAESATVIAEVGDCGAASALLGACAALDAAGIVAVVAAGGGRTTGLTIDADAPVPGAARTRRSLQTDIATTYPDVLRARRQLIAGGETVPMGVPPESALFARGADEMLGLLGGRCIDCGTISTPPSVHPTCIACGAPKLEPVALARAGTVHTFVVNQTMPAPFVAPLPIAVLDLDDGARLMLQVAGDGSELAVGTRVELVLRKYAHERGVPVYGFKARPVRDVEESAS
ncbi:MAG TPA: OB-fold domain-containing protein [Acidimicrobiia bacterium]|nr:OB-fold domain-containing protein [Acidimicrobiia bacterium]